MFDGKRLTKLEDNLLSWALEELEYEEYDEDEEAPVIFDIKRLTLRHTITAAAVEEVRNVLHVSEVNPEIEVNVNITYMLPNNVGPAFRHVFKGTPSVTAPMAGNVKCESQLEFSFEVECSSVALVTQL
jgi:hypothetical protein